MFQSTVTCKAYSVQVSKLRQANNFQRRSAQIQDPMALIKTMLAYQISSTVPLPLYG
jgi:hypothetical protein